MVLKLKRKSEWEKLYEQVDKADAEVKRLKSLGLDATMQESFAKTLRRTSYSFERLSRKTMVELVKGNDPKALARWSKMEKEMKEGRLHPRELKMFYDSLMTKK